MPIYKLHAPIVAINCRTNRFTILPVGSLLQGGDAIQVFGPVPVTCDGEQLEVFTRDLEERAELVARPKPVGRAVHQRQHSCHSRL